MADFEQALNSILSDPDAMEQIMALAGKLGGEPPTAEDSLSPPESPVQAVPPPPDPRQAARIGKLLELFQTSQQGNREAVALLAALRPFLRRERQETLERAIRLAGLSRTAQEAYRLWREGELRV